MDDYWPLCLVRRSDDEELPAIYYKEEIIKKREFVVHAANFGERSRVFQERTEAQEEGKFFLAALSL